MKREIAVKGNLLAIALSLPLLLSAAAKAQTTQLKVTVPFEFIAGDTVLPAGYYDVQSIGPWGGKTLSIHSGTSNAGALFLSNSCQSAKASDRSTLVFYRYGQKYFLAKVWTANTQTCQQMLLNHHHTELARNQQKTEVVLMASEK
jgi:hypothetical protein